jgi:hypothetical protein
MATTRWMFDSLEAAASGLIVILENARTTAHRYTIEGLSAEVALQSGVVLTGEVDDVNLKMNAVPGAARHDE